MYDVLYGVPPSMLTMIDCGRVARGVLPLKAIDIPTNPSLSLILLKSFKGDSNTRRTLKGHLKWAECCSIGERRERRGSIIPRRLLIDAPILRAAISDVLGEIVENHK